VEIAHLVAALRREGQAFADAAEAADLDTPIPTTPGWRMRDLVRHMGDVHRWARAHVAEGRVRPIGKDDLPGVAGPLPDDAGLLPWFREGHARLVATLETADPDTQCWTFLPAPSPLAFWARRQAHETGIHRADAQSPGDQEAITSFDPGLATDGIDELLLGFFAGDLQAQPVDGAPTLFLRAMDTDAAWLVALQDRSLRWDGPDPPADCSVRGGASDLFLLLWNRRDAEGLDVRGDRSLLDTWRKHAQIHWSRPR
jgi:uncharacterized protein (TIGR03083 family)